MGHSNIMSSLLLGAAVCGLMAPASAWAQDERANAAERPSAEIIVTARKRQESILKVPVVETVVTGETLQTYQITDLLRLQQRVPGLLLGGQAGNGGAQVSIRGIGTTTLDAGVDQSVILNLDGLSMTQGLAFDSAFFDVAQVEVLKGPQALFYGKNSPGGVISLRTNDPGEEFEVIARAGYEFEARERRGELILSGPVSEAFGVRLASAIDDMDGFFRNRATAFPGTGAITPTFRRVDNKRSYILRGTIVLKPVTEFSARLKVNYVDDHIDGNSGMSQLSSCPDGTGMPVGGFGVPFIHPSDNCKLDRDFYTVYMDPAVFRNVQNNGVPFADTEQFFGTLELTYRPRPEITVTSVTGYYKIDGESLGNGIQTGYAGPGLFSYGTLRRRDFTQELRVDTDFAGPFNLAAGGYYQDGQIRTTSLIGGNTTYARPAVIASSTQQLDIKSYSLFGQARFKPAEQFEIAAGVRWAKERRTALAFPGTVLSSNNFSPELTLTYTPTDDLTIFGSLKQGYKSGSFALSSPNPQLPFGDERIRGGEVGLKTRMLDRALNVNLAGYYYNYKGLQVQANTPGVNGLPTVRTFNAGGARIYGVDFDLTYRMPSVDGLTLNGSINWTHARFTDLRGVPCWGGQTIALGCNTLPNAAGVFTSQDLTGTRLVRAPDWQLQAGFDYETPIGSGLKLKFGADAQYTSKYPTTLAKNRPDINQKGYTLISAHTEVATEDDRWEVSFVGNNLLNEITTGRCDFINMANGQLFGGTSSGTNAVGIAGVNELICKPRRGRELWVRLTFRPMASGDR